LEGNQETQGTGSLAVVFYGRKTKSYPIILLSRDEALFIRIPSVPVVSVVEFRTRNRWELTLFNNKQNSASPESESHWLRLFFLNLEPKQRKRVSCLSNLKNACLRNGGQMSP